MKYISATLDLLVHIQRTATKIIQGMEPFLLGGQAVRAGAVQLGEEKAVGRPDSSPAESKVGI